MESKNRSISCEKQLAEIALKDRGCSETLRLFIQNELSQRKEGQRPSEERVKYEHYGLAPLHEDLNSWLYVSQDPQLAIAVEEIVNTFSPALSLELLLYNVLGSNNESATCLVRYLINYYTSNLVCAHIKTTLRNMIHWAVLAGFIPCMFVPWKKLRTLGLGFSGKALLSKLLSSSYQTSMSHEDIYTTHMCDDYSQYKTRPERNHKYVRTKRKNNKATVVRTGNSTSMGGHNQIHSRAETKSGMIKTICDGLSPPQAAYEAVQEREAHQQALPSLLTIPLNQLHDTLHLLMNNSVPSPQVSVVCKILQDWIQCDTSISQDPIKETELKMAMVALWGVMKTLEHGRCPVIPECKAMSCLAFYDTETDLVTALVDGVLYRHISIWDSSWSSRNPYDFSTLAKRAHKTVKTLADLHHSIVQGLTTAATRHIYTSAGTDHSSLMHLADIVLSNRREHEHIGLSVAGNAFDRPLLDNLSRFLVTDQQCDMFGINVSELPDIFTRSGVGTSVSEHKSASVSHKLSKMMASMISEGKEVLLVRQFLSDVTRNPCGAFEQLKERCKDHGLLHMAECIVRQLERLGDDRHVNGHDQVKSQETVTELGSNIRLVCSYPSTVSVAHIEEVLSLLTNFWRSALSGFCQFNRRHNTIQYNNRDTVRELESGSPVHVFHSMLVSLLNTSGVTFADSLSGRKPDTSLTVNDIMLTRDSLHPAAYGLLLASKLGLRASDVKSHESTNGMSLSHHINEQAHPVLDAGACVSGIDSGLVI